MLEDHRIAAKACLLTTRAAKWATRQVGLDLHALELEQLRAKVGALEAETHSRGQQLALLNEKLDLAQAEAIADLIDAGSRAAVRAAMLGLFN